MAVLLSLALTSTVTVAVAVTLTASSASAAPGKLGLGTAEPFAVLAASAVTNTGPSVLNGDLGLSPGTAVTGFPPGTVVGTQHVTDAVALQAENDLTTAYNDAAGRTPDVDKSNQDLGGQTLVGGVYNASAAMALTGTLTLDAQGNPDTVFVFQAGSTLIASTNSTVQLVGAAQACNVFWQVGSSATLRTSTRFVGTIMALTSATLETDAQLEGRVLARNGAVTLDTNVISRPGCATAPPPTTTPPTTTPPTTPPPTTTTPPTSTPPTSAPTTSAPTTPAAPTTSPTTPPSTDGPRPGGSGGTSGDGDGDWNGTGTGTRTDTKTDTKRGDGSKSVIIPVGRPDTGFGPANGPVRSPATSPTAGPATGALIGEPGSPLGWLWAAFALACAALIATGTATATGTGSSRISGIPGIRSLRRR